MTFCVSHQKQPDNDPDSDANVANTLITNNDSKVDVERNDSKSTENTNLGKHET